MQKLRMLLLVDIFLLFIYTYIKGELSMTTKKTYWTKAIFSGSLLAVIIAASIQTYRRYYQSRNNDATSQINPGHQNQYR
jgi:Na+/H+-translocating membrane pyrophosphatase